MKFENLITKKKRLDRRTRISKQLKNYTATAILSFLLTSTGWGYYYNTSPKPVKQTIEVKAVEVTPEPEKVTNHSIMWLVDKIWLMESSRGKNGITGSLQKYCEDKGLWNEYGYGGMSQKICFKDRAEANETMIKWFEKQFRTKTESQTICYYRYGELMSNCDYYQNIIKTK